MKQVNALPVAQRVLKTVLATRSLRRTQAHKVTALTMLAMQNSTAAPVCKCCATTALYALRIKVRLRKVVHPPSAVVDTCLGVSIAQQDDMLSQHILEEACTCAVLM